MAKAKAKSKYKEKDAEREDRPARPKAHNDAYVMMLVITLCAILAGIGLLYLDYKEYGGKSPPKEVLPPLAELGKGPMAGDGKPKDMP